LACGKQFIYHVKGGGLFFDYKSAKACYAALVMGKKVLRQSLFHTANIAKK
jgi:hypothetical protein